MGKPDQAGIALPDVNERHMQPAIASRQNNGHRVEKDPRSARTRHGRSASDQETARGPARRALLTDDSAAGHPR